jgi:hypothetical protein
MLAAVEHEQHLLVLQKIHQTGHRLLGADRRAERGSECARHEQRVGQRRQIDEAGSVLVKRDSLFGHGQRDGGLADPSRPNHRYEASFRQLNHERIAEIGPADHPRQGGWQIMRALGSGTWRRQGPLPLRKDNRCDEAIAPAGNVGDVAIARLTVAQKSAQGCDIDPKITFRHEGVGPGAGDKLFLADEIARAFDQGNEDVKGAAADTERLSASRSRCWAGSRRKGPNEIARSPEIVNGSGTATSFNNI